LHEDVCVGAPIYNHSALSHSASPRDPRLAHALESEGEDEAAAHGHSHTPQHQHSLSHAHSHKKLHDHQHDSVHHHHIVIPVCVLRCTSSVASFQSFFCFWFFHVFSLTCKLLGCARLFVVWCRATRFGCRFCCLLFSQSTLSSKAWRSVRPLRPAFDALHSEVSRCSLIIFVLLVFG
jgi:hypothetical protein